MKELVEIEQIDRHYAEYYERINPERASKEIQLKIEMD